MFTNIFGETYETPTKSAEEYADEMEKENE